MILTIINGNFTPSELRSYIVVHVILTFGFLFLAYLSFIRQNKYSIFTHTVSFLGSWVPERNPKGWILFSISMILSGILLFPLIFFFFKQMVIISKVIAWMALLLGVIGAGGFVGIGLIPDNEHVKLTHSFSYGKVHDTIAIITILSFFLMILVIGVLLIINKFTNVLEVHGSVAIGFSIMLLIAGGAITTQIIWAKKCKEDSSKKIFPGEGIYSFPLWEWMLYLMLFVMVYWIALAIKI